MKSIRSRNAFTIIELLVSISIVMVLLVVLFQMVGQTSAMWKYTSGKAEQFRSARAAFDAITRRLREATLNTYWDYSRDKNGNIQSGKYLRRSELRFISGQATDLLNDPDAKSHAVFFQAPLGFVSDVDGYRGLDNLLNSWGYYVEHNSDKRFRPGFINTQSTVPEKNRYRLMEFMQPSEDLKIYDYTSGRNADNSEKSINPTEEQRTAWFRQPISDDKGATDEVAEKHVSHVLADNVVALVILPKLSIKEDDKGNALAPDYSYDSSPSKVEKDPAVDPRNQLPPVVQVTMVAIDEVSAARVERENIDLGVEALFKKSDQVTYDADLAKLEQNLIDNGLKYRVFSSNVSIRGAKWSRN